MTDDPILEQMAATPRQPAEVPAPAAAPDAGDGTDSILEQMAAEHGQATDQAARLMRYRAANDVAVPERRAQVLKYAAATGMAPELVEKDFDTVKRQTDASNIDWGQLRAKQPGLAQYLDTRPEGHPLVQDDLDNLHGIESALVKPWLKFKDASVQVAIDAVDAVRDAWEESPFSPKIDLSDGMHISNLMSGATVSRGEPSARAALAEKVAARGDYGAKTLPEKMLVGSAGALPVMAEYTAAGAAGGVGGVAALAIQQTTQSTEERLGAYRDERGEKLDPDSVYLYSHLGGLVGGALMAAPIGKAVGLFGKGAAMLPGASALVKRVSGDAVEQILARGAGPLVRRMAAQWGLHTLNAGVLMGLQGAAEQASLEGAKGAAGMETQPGAIANAFADSFVGAVRDMALVSATGPGHEFLRDTARLAASRSESKRVAQLVDSAAASKLLERSPDEAQAAVGAMAAQPEADKSLSIPVEEWNRYWQGKKVNPAEVASRVLEDGGRSYSEATATSGDISIPADKLLAKLGKTEHLAGLKDDIRIDSASLTPREARAEGQRIQQRLEQVAKERAPELDQGAAEVERFIREQAVEADIGKDNAVQNAKTAAEHMRTMAIRTGLSIPDVVVRSGLDRLRILNAQGEPVAPQAWERFQRFLEPSASAQLAERARSLSQEARQAELYRDTNTGVLNEAARRELPADPARPLVARVEGEGIKYLNETTSHDRADLLYRAWARALHEVIPDVSKPDGGFEFNVKDQAEADRVLARTKELLPPDARRFELTVSVGKNRGEAALANRAVIDQRVAAGERANPRPANPAEPEGKPLSPEKPRGLGELSASDLALPTDKAQAAIPEQLQQRVAGMSDESYFREAYLDKAPNGEPTGILNAKGWEHIARRPVVASLDLKGLRDINERLGTKVGDAFIRAFSRAAAKVGGVDFDFAHLHGDEFALQGESEEAVTAHLEKIREAIQNVGFRYTDAKGVEQFKELAFRHGIGDSYEAADRDLNERKSKEGPGRQQLAAGEAGGAGARRDAPRRADNSRNVLLEGGAGRDEQRGVRLQAFPERLRKVPVARIEGQPVTFEQGPKAGEARGSIDIRVAGGKPVAFDIRALSGDRSTLAHEMGHFLSWSIHNIATSDVGTPEIRADYQRLLDFAGYKDAEERSAALKDPAASAAKEERISHAWEQYLAEGKAPSAELARPFSRFRSWMLRVYRSLPGIRSQYEATYGQPLEMSDEVRGVFDRMLATDEAIQQARAGVGSSGAPLPAAMAGMSASERETYQRALDDARIGAEQEVTQRMAEIQGQEVDASRARFRREAETEVDSQPVYRAWRFLQRGELATGGGTLGEKELPEPFLGPKGEPLKLDRKAFLAQFGPDAARRMPPGAFVQGNGKGSSADEVGALFGYESGKDFVADVLKAKPRDGLIEEKTQAKVDESFGPALQRLQEAAMGAVHSDAAAQAALLELRALAKQVNPAVARRVSAVSLSTLKDTAAAMVADTPVGELNPEKYARAEYRSALKAERLWGEGKKEDSVAEREARLLNAILYREARDKAAELDSARRALESPSNTIRGELGLASPIYRDVHDQLLAAAGLVDAPQSGSASIDALVQKAASDAQELAFDVQGVRDVLAKPKAWEALTVEQAQNVADALTNIRHLARLSRQLTLAGERVDRDTWFADLQAHLSRRQPQAAVPYSRTAEGFGHRAGHLGRGIDAKLTDVAETYSEMLDTGDRQGPVHRLLVDARLASRAKETELTKRVLKPIRDAWAKVPRDIRKMQGERMDQLAQLLPVPERLASRVAPIYTRDTLWSLFLNWGNEDNRQRIRTGNGWTDEQVTKALGLLTREERTFLQGTLDTVNSLYPDLAGVHEARTGLKLPKVAATPIEVEGETYAGGYFPLRYDSRFSRQGEVQQGDVVASLFQPNYLRPTTPAGHRKARAQRVNAPVDLSWGVVPAHLAQVIHDISYGDWVRQSGSVLLDGRFKGLSAQYLGQERAQEFIPWLRDVANNRADSAAGTMSDVSRSLEAFGRARLAVAVMGLNIPNLLQNAFDPWGANLEGIGRTRIALSFLKVMAPWNWGSIPEFGLSKELSYRETAFADNLRRELSAIGPVGDGVARAVSETTFRLYDWLDHFTTRVAFKAAYDDAMLGGLTQEEAVTRADDVVRRTFASHDIAERPPILRSKHGLAAVVTFYSWANRRYNQLRRNADALGRVWGNEESTFTDKTSAVADLAAKAITMGLVSAAGSYFAGRGPRDEEDLLDWVIWRVLLEPANTVPFIGPAAEALVKGQQVDARTAPVLSFAQDQVNRLATYARRLENGSASDADKLWGAVQVMLGLAGGPVGQTQRTGDYVKQLVTGEAEPRGPADFASGLVYGARKNQPANPLRNLQDAAE